MSWAGRTGAPLKLLLAGLVWLSCAVPSAAAAQPLRTGVFDTAAFTLGDDVAFVRVREAGAVYIKLLVDWSQVAPTRPSDPSDPADPAYRWDTVDRFVRQARSNGLDPVLTIAGSPAWARADAGCKAGPSCAPRPRDFGQFAGAAAKRYSGDFSNLPRVGLWQAWSEPNLDFFLVPTSPGVYREMLRAFTPAVRRGSPGSRVIAGGLAPLGGPDARAPLSFMRDLLCMSGRAKPRPRPGCNGNAPFDIWSTHPYTTGGPTHGAESPDDVSLGDLGLMTRLLRAAEEAGRIDSSSRDVPFWVTEFSWDTRPPDPGGVPTRRHARWTAEALFRMWQAGVSAVFWFTLRDQPLEGKPGETFQSGLYLRGKTIRQDKPKLSLRAFRFPLVALPSGSRVRVWGRAPDSRAGKVLMQARSGEGGWTGAGHLHANRFGIFSGSLAFSVRPRELRAVVGGQTSIPFGVRRTKDAYQPPFGGRRLAGRAGPLVAQRPDW